MMNIRVGMVGGAGRSAGQAATIAIRYSCIRRQGFKDSRSSEAMTAENSIMDYKMQQFVLPHSLRLWISCGSHGQCWGIAVTFRTLGL